MRFTPRGRGIRSATTAGPITPAVVKRMLGTWTGPINQIGSRPYSVVLVLNPHGDLVSGVVEYPELNCTGVLDSARSIGPTTSAIRETIHKGNCVKDVGLELTLKDGKLSYYFGSRTGVQAEGTGILERKR